MMVVVKDDLWVDKSEIEGSSLYYFSGKFGFLLRTFFLLASFIKKIIFLPIQSINNNTYFIMYI